MAKKFGAGVVTGVLATVGALAAGLATYKKKVVEPEQKEAVKKDKMLKTTNTNNIRFNEYGFDFSYKNDGNEKYYILVWDLIENLENE